MARNSFPLSWEPGCSCSGHKLLTSSLLSLPCLKLAEAWPSLSRTSKMHSPLPPPPGLSTSTLLSTWNALPPKSLLGWLCVFSLISAEATPQRSSLTCQLPCQHCITCVFFTVSVPLQNYIYTPGSGSVAFPAGFHEIRHPVSS